MQSQISHKDYPVLFKLDMQGRDGINEFSAQGNVVQAKKGFTYRSSNSSISDTELAKYGGGPIINYFCGSSYTAPSAIGTTGDGYYFRMTNYSSSDQTPAASTQLYMMLPLCHVERVMFDA